MMGTSRRPRGLFAPALLLAAAIAAPTLADAVSVDLELGPRDRVDGTLRPATERETFLLDLPRGASLRAVVQARGDGGPEPSLAVLDPDGQEVATTVAKRARKASLPSLVAEESGGFRFVVRGDDENDGDYLLKLKVKADSTWSGASEADLAPGAETVFAFAAPAGAEARLTLVSAGSPLVPRLVEVTGPDFQAPIDGAGATPARHRVAGLALPATGEYLVRIRNDGAAAGRWKLKVKLKLPPDAKRQVDLRDSALAGDYAGEQAVYGRVVPVGGGVLDGATVGLNLAGCAVTVPPGAVDLPLLVSFSESLPFFVGDDEHAGGLALKLEPAGTVFAEAVTVTVPYSEQAYDDVEQDLTIYVEGEGGDLEAVPGPYTFDLANGTVSFQTSHFSRFQSTSRRPRPVAGDFAEIEIVARALPGFGGEVTFALNDAQGFQGSRTGNQFLDFLDRHTLRWTSPAEGQGELAVETDTGVLAGVVDVQNDERVRMDLFTFELNFLRGRTPDAIFRRAQGPAGSSLAIALRRARGRPSRGNLVGKWHAVVLEFGAMPTQDGRVDLRQAALEADLVVDPFARVWLRGVRRSVATSTFPGAGWTLAEDAPRLPPTRFRPSPDREVALETDFGLSAMLPEVSLEPVLGGDLLVGLAQRDFGDPGDPVGGVMRLVILVRADEEIEAADLAGRALFGAVGTDVTPGSDAFAGRLRALTLRHDATGGVTFTGTDFRVGHDAQGEIAATADPVDDSASYSVGRDGSLVYTKLPPRSVVTRRRGLHVFAEMSGGRFALGFGLPARPEPPQ